MEKEMYDEKMETGFNEPSFDGVCSVCGFPNCFVRGQLESAVFCPRCLKTQKRSFPRKKERINPSSPFSG